MSQNVHVIFHEKVEPIDGTEPFIEKTFENCQSDIREGCLVLSFSDDAFTDYFYPLNTLKRVKVTTNSTSVDTSSL